MNIKEAKQEITHTIQAYLKKDEAGGYCIPAIRQRPILLMGPPGIGKTQIMEQVARECHVGLVAYTITHHTRQSAVGLPFIKEEVYAGKKYSVTEYTMSEIIASIYRKMEETGQKEGILFIDEINCVSETLAPTMLQFLQCKTFGNQAVPEGWIIVAAGNPPEYNRSVRDFDMVTLDRVRRIDIEADYAVWKEYARQQGMHGALLSYLELRPNNFYKVESDVDGLCFVTARGWEDLSSLMQIYEQMGLSVNEEIVHEFLRHEDVAEDVAAYIDLYKKYQDDYGIPDILQGNVKPQVYERVFRAAFDEKLSVVNLLLDGLLLTIREAQETKTQADAWFAFLKEYKKRLTEGETKELYAHMLQQRQEQTGQAVKAGYYDRTQQKLEQQLLQLLKENQPEEGGTPQEKFAGARKGFEAFCDTLETKETAASQAIEYAFDFMENAMPQGQELLVFVTELTITSQAAQFLSQHPCARYLQYNRELLIGTRRTELLKELER